jgi:hypothetical protein
MSTNANTATASDVVNLIKEDNANREEIPLVHSWYHAVFLTSPDPSHHNSVR